MSSSIYLAVPVMMLLVVVQTAVLPRFPILGYIPQLPLLVALSWGLLRGVNEGVVWGFVGGLCLDLFSVGPVGVTSLAFMLAILAVTWIGNAMPTNRFFIPIAMSFLATLIYLIAYMLILRLLGYQTTLQTTTSLLPLAILHGALILPSYWLIYYLGKLFRPRRAEL